jgi:hypothetical protein
MPRSYDPTTDPGAEFPHLFGQMVGDEAASYFFHRETLRLRGSHTLPIAGLETKHRTTTQLPGPQRGHVHEQEPARDGWCQRERL